MRQLIIDLGDIYKKERTAKITAYIQGQFSRVVILNETPVSLHDVPERDICCAVEEVIDALGLTFAELQQHVNLVPAVDRKRNVLTVIAELAPSFFRELLNSSGFVSINDEVVLLTTDDHVVTGSNAHVEFKKRPRTADSALMAACVNLTVDGRPASCGIGYSELDAIKTSYIDIKYGGLNPFTESEWESIYLASVFRRLLKDDAMIMGLQKMQGAMFERYHAAIEHHSAYFKKQQEADNIIRNAFGSVIGRRVQLFTAEELAREMQRDKFSTKVVPFSRSLADSDFEVDDSMASGLSSVDLAGFPTASADDGTDALARAMAGDFSYLQNSAAIGVDAGAEDDDDDIYLTGFVD